MVAGGGETQQELILFKHKEWSVVDLVLSELTVTKMGSTSLVVYGVLLPSFECSPYSQEFFGEKEIRMGQ